MVHSQSKPAGICATLAQCFRLTQAYPALTDSGCLAFSGLHQSILVYISFFCFFLGQQRHQYQQMFECRSSTTPKTGRAALIWLETGRIWSDMEFLRVFLQDDANQCRFPQGRLWTDKSIQFQNNNILAPSNFTPTCHLTGSPGWCAHVIVLRLDMTPTDARALHYRSGL